MPVATARYRARFLAVGAATTIALSVVAPATAAPADPATGQQAPATAARASSEPVIMVHGWRGKGAEFAPMQQAFDAAGRPAYTIDLPGQNNVTNAHAIAELVSKVRAETGAAKVNLVAHSMGGISSRHYVKFLGGIQTVRNYVSIGSPQQGYLPGCLLVRDDLGAQMCPFNQFMKELNAGDDTPGDVGYTTLRGDDEIEAITRLDGGACHAYIPGVSHGQQPGSPEVFAAVRSAIDGSCPGRFVGAPGGGVPRV